MTSASQMPGPPVDFDALVAFAWREHRAGRLAAAAAAYRKIVALRPEVAEAHNNLGSVLLDQGRLDEAAAEFQQAVALKPSLFQAHNNLGNVLRQQGQFDQAVACYERAIALRSELTEVHNNLASVLLDQGRLDAAAAHFRQIVALDPGNFQALNDLGCIYQEQGQLDQAAACYGQVLALRPDLAEVHNNLAGALKQQGKFAAAAGRYDQALALQPDFAQALYDRSDLKTFRVGDPDLAHLESLAADTGRLPPAKMLYVHFALAKALEDVGDYRRAFEHLLRGNALKRREIHYNEAACRQTFRLIAQRSIPRCSIVSRRRAIHRPRPSSCSACPVPAAR